MSNTLIATFGNGCFWCTEAVFQRMKGVTRVRSGYSGGHTANPTYGEVCTGATGHAECVEVTYDPSVINFEDLLSVFWATHDPTTLNRQGNDVGTQYRSVIFYHSEDQKEKAVASKEALDLAGVFSEPIVTAIVPATVFYPAEQEHSDYYNRHSAQPYCYYVARPKIQTLKKLFPEMVDPQSSAEG